MPMNKRPPGIRDGRRFRGSIGHQAELIPAGRTAHARSSHQVLIHHLQTGTSNALPGKSHVADAAVFAGGDGVVAMRQRDIGYRFSAT